MILEKAKKVAQAFNEDKYVGHAALNNFLGEIHSLTGEDRNTAIVAMNYLMAVEKVKVEPSLIPNWMLYQATYAKEILALPADQMMALVGRAKALKEAV